MKQLLIFKTTIVVCQINKLLRNECIFLREMIGDGGGRKYANRQFSDKNRQAAISRVSAVQNSARGPR